MEEKKIKYPFKNFVKNILLGIILILSVFCAMPVVNAITDNVSSNVEAGNSGTVKFVAWGIKDGEYSALPNQKWNSGFLGSTYHAYQAWETKSNRLVYYNDGTSYKDYSGNDLRARAFENGYRTFTVNDSTISFWCQWTKIKVAGIFTGTNFTADQVYSWGESITLTSNLPSTLYILYVDSKRDDSDYADARVSGEYKLKVDNYTFQTNYMFRENLTLKILAKLSTTLEIGDGFLNNVDATALKVDGYTCTIKLEHTGKVIPLDDYYVFYSKNKKLQFYSSSSGRKISTSESYTSKSGSKLGYSCSITYEKTSSNNTDRFSWTNNKVQFDIYSAGDLEDFAEQVNLGYLNKGVGSNYRAVLKSNISSYTGDPIGAGENDYSFKGEFDGQGHTIGTATINPIEGAWERYAMNDATSGRMYTSYEWYVRSVAFGFFGYVNSAQIKNFEIKTIKVNKYTASKYVTNSNGILKTNKTYQSDVLSCGVMGVLCASSSNSTFDNISITNSKISITQYPGGSITVGGLVGSVSGGTINNCDIDFKISIGIKDEVDVGNCGNICLGGLVGSASGVAIQNSKMTNYNVSGKSFQKHDKNRFYAGGLVGKMTGGSISACSVDGGTQDFTGIYHTEVIAIGGLVGYQQGGKISSSISKSLIKLNNLVGSGANDVADYLCVGGLVGFARSGAQIENCRYENSKTLKIISGQDAGGGIFKWLNWWQDSRYVIFGGLVGWTGYMQSYNETKSDVTITNSSAYITGGVQMGSSGYQNDNSFFGFFVGNNAGGTTTLTNCYSIIKNENSDGKESITTDSYTKNTLIVDAVNTYGGTVSFTNCYISRGDVGGTHASLTNNKNSTGSYEDNKLKVFKNESQKDYMNTLFGTLYNSSNKTVNAIQNSQDGSKYYHNYTYRHPVYGYNSGIQYGGIAGDIAGPFVLGSAGYENYISILIDCTTNGQTITCNNAKQGYQYENDGMKYIYGAGVLSASGTRYSYTFPTVLKDGVKKCTYYSLYKTGVDGNNKPSIFAKPGDVISTNISNNQENSYGKTNLQLGSSVKNQFTLYPIFDELYTIYSATRLQIYDGNSNSWAYRASVSYTIAGDNVQVSETKLTDPDGIYIYAYNILTKKTIDSNQVVDFIRACIKLETTETNNRDINTYFKNYAETAITHSSLNDVIESGRTIKYFSGKGKILQSESDYKKYTEDETNVDISEKLYFHVFRMSDFYVGQLTTDENGNAIKIGTSYAGDYTKKLTIPLFFAGLWSDNTETIRINSNFSGYTNYDGFGNLFVQSGNNKRIVYVAAGSLRSSNPATKIIDDNGNEYKKLGIYNNSGIVTWYMQSEYTYSENFNLYPLYQEPGIFLRYYKDYNDGNPTIDRIEYQYNGSTPVTTYTVSIKNYNDLFGEDLKRYDFVGWELSLGTSTLFVYSKSFSSITIPSGWVTGSQIVYLDFKPVFVTKNDKPISELNVKDYDITFNTKDNTYTINSAYDLIYVSYLVNFGNETDIKIKLGQNIDMTGIKNFMPIGFNTESSFNGYFDGQGYNIYNLSITGKTSIETLSLTGISSDYHPGGTYTTSDVYVGLFGVMYRGEGAGSEYSQKSVNLINISYNYVCDSDINVYMGGFAGYADGDVRISNILVDGKIEFANAVNADSRCYIGGISGRLGGYTGHTAVINECVSRVKMEVVDKVNYYYKGEELGLGSIVGQMDSYSTIRNCFDRSNETDFTVNGNAVNSLAEYQPQVSWGLVGHYKYSVNENRGVFSNLLKYLRVKVIGVEYARIMNCYSSLDKLNVSSGEYKNNFEKEIKNIYATKQYDVKFSYSRDFGISNNNVVLASNISKFNMYFSDYSTWAQDDNVNDGYPYLKNTGIRTINFVIDGWLNGEGSYYLTPEDKTRMTQIGATKVEDKNYMVNQDYFVLDILSYFGWESGTSRGEDEYSGSLSNARKKEFGGFFNDKIEDLTFNDEKFWQLEGYDFSNLDASYDDLGDKYKNTGWDAELVANLFHYADGKTYNVFANFTPKEIAVKYVFRIDGKEYIVDDGISGKSSLFANTYTSQQININSLETELQQKLYAKIIKSFRIYLPEKNTYLNISGDYSELGYVDESESLGYSVGTKFMLSRIDKYKEGYQLYLIITEDDLEDIEFKLNFFDENEKEHIAFDTNGELTQWNEDSAKYEDASLNYIIKKYNDVLAQNPNYFPTIFKTGYTLKGWGYYPENDKTKTLSTFYSSGDMNMPDLRLSPWLGTYDGKYYYLDLYPIFEKNTFTNTRYYDGYESLTSAEFITYHNDSDFGGIPKYGEKIKLYNHDKLSEFEVYKKHPGYKLSGFIFTDDTVDAINALTSKQKDDTIAYINSLASDLGVSCYTLCGVDEISRDYLAKACINVLNYMLKTDSEFDYFLPLAVDLICIYDKATELEFKVELTNSNEVDMYYQIYRKTRNYDNGTISFVEETTDIAKLEFNQSTENSNYIAYINVYYNDVIYIYTNLKNGTKINTITYEYSGSNLDLYEFTSYGTSLEKFIQSDLLKFACINIGVIENGTNYNGIEGSLTYYYDIENYNNGSALTKDTDQYYLISSEADLTVYFNDIGINGSDSIYKLAKLTNNINITGLKLNINTFPKGFVLDGNGYTLNGFTNFNIDMSCLNSKIDSNYQAYEFITFNYGTIKNLNFDNICINLSITKIKNFGLITYNIGDINNVNILGGNLAINSLKIVEENEDVEENNNILIFGGLVSENNGTINNFSVQNLEISITSERNVFAGLVCGSNFGELNNIAINDENTLTISSTGTNYASLCAGINSSMISETTSETIFGTIKNVIINFGNITAQNQASLVAYSISGQYIGIISYVADFTNLSFVGDFNLKIDSIQKISDNTSLNTILNQKFVGSNFKFVYDYLTKTEKLVIPSVNVHLINIKTVNNLENKEIEFDEKINDVFVDEDKQIVFVNNVFNKLKFNSTDYAENANLNFVFEAFRNGKDQTNNLIVSNQVNQGAINQNQTNAYINAVRVPKEDTILFEYSANEYKNFSFALTYTKSSNFSDDEKAEIQKSIKILVNGKETILVFADNGTGMVGLKNSDGDIVKLRYFDKIEIKFDFPSIAFLSENGLKLGKTIVENEEKSSKYAQQFDYTHYLEAAETKFVAEVTRRAVKITFDLNKESLTDETEKNKIKFNEDAIKKLLTDKGYKAVINDLGQLEVEVAPTYEFAQFVYKLPKIIEIIDENLYQILDYVDNGINYKFDGFVGENDNIYYYNSDFIVVREKFNDNLTLQAKYEKVKYTIEIDDLSGDCYFSILNGYATNNGKTQKNIYFSDNMSAPIAQMLVYTNSYVFKGYKIKNTDIMVSSATKLSDGTISHTFNETFETLNANYTSHREENEFKIILIPVFEEVGYDLVFKDGENNDEYSAYLYYEDSEYDANHYDEIHMNLSISKILGGNYVLPLGDKEHHSFVGFSLEDDETQQIVIAYKNGEFVYNKEILIGSKTFVAVYEIDKVEIKLEIKDVNTQNKLDYEVVNLNDVLSVAHSYKIDDEKNIVFIVDYNTTNFNLPEIRLTDENYKFSNYMLDNNIYSLSYKFTQNTTINISCMYKIIYQTKLAEIKNTYYLVSSNRLNKADELSYSFYANFDETITLPTKDEVTKTGFKLSGYKKDGDNLAFEENTPSTFVAVEKSEIEFIFTGETYSLILDAQEYSCKLPKSLINRYIESYDLVEGNESKAIIKVVYGTLVEDIRNALPALSVDGYTFDGYEFSETGTITQNGTITPKFLQNEYEIIVYDADGTRITDITKHFNEEIDSSFYQTIESHANNTATTNNAVFKGLSLDKKYYIEFANSETMPSLEKDYKNYVEKTGNKYTIKVYCYYISNIIITINAHENSMIKNENTQGVSEFSGGDAYNASAKFKLSANDIMSGATIVLPIPQIKQDSELEFANFVGYSMMVGENKIIVVDNLGKLLDDFDYTQSNIELIQEFEYKTYNFNILATYDSVQNDEYFGFETNSYGLSKQIKFNETISNLPILNLTHYNFVGYYFSNNNGLVVDDQDVMIADFDGKLLSDYENFGMQYFEKVNGQYQLKSIYAKYEIKYIDVVIKTSNAKLGTVSPIYLLDGTILTYSQIENGYSVKIPSGKDILISANVNSLVATFKNWTINLSGVDVTNNSSIENALNQSTIITNITESYEIVANYDYITFNITYIIDGEEQELTPKEFNIDTPEFNLPIFEKYGYNFVGWYLEENFINIKQTINPSVYSRDLTLYGKIENKKVNLNIYSLNVQGYTLHSTITATYNKFIDSLPNIVLDGYYFVGFFTGENADGIKINSSSLSIFVDDTNIYAFFEEKIQNNLSGEGTEANPYEICNEQDFKVFVQMSNYEKVENKYFKLSSSINLTEKYVINSFNSNFDGDGYVLYLKNGLHGYNYLNSDGKIIKNISLFGENEGQISNLTIVLSQNNVEDVINGEDLKTELQINLSLFANENNGEIKNVIAYFNFNLQDLNFENEINSFDAICKNNQNVTDYSIVNSVLTDKNSSKTFDNVLDKHLHNKNVMVVNQNAENVFEISSAEEFAYLLYENIEEEINISLKSNIDFKGKLLQKTSNKLNIQGNGYILSNFIILDQDYLFDTLTLNKTAIEKVTLINLYNNCNLILDSNKLDYSYIEIDLTNCQNLISQNSGEINNSYFVSNSLINLIANNNSNINNVYLINLNKPTGGTFTNFEVFDLNNLDNVDSFIENSSNLDVENLWFKDTNKVMSDYQLPKLIGVGNVVYDIIFDENIMKITVFDKSFVNNNLIITKDVEELIIYVQLTDSQQNLVDILLNNQSCFDNFDNAFSIIIIPKTNLNYNEIEFVSELKNFDVNIEVDIKGKGNKIQIGENSGEELTISVQSGTKVSDLNIQTIAGDGYKFVGYSIFNENGNEISESDPTIISNTKIVVKFKNLISYKLYLNNYENIVVIDNKLENFWNKVQENEYIIYLAENENIDDYLPKLSKQDYVFNLYSILKVGDLEYKVLPSFSADYVTVTFKYNNMLSSVDLVSENEYSLVSPELKIVEKEGYFNDIFYVLRGYDITLKIDFNGSYLTRITVNDEDLFDDYSEFVNNDEQIVKTISLDRNLNEHTINISLNEIIVETKFEFDKDLCSIELLNAAFDLSDYTVSTRKNFDLQFEITIDASKTLDSITFTNSLGEEVEAEYIQQENKITYIAKESLTIKINLTDKKLLVVINQTEGGSVEVDSDLERTIIDENSYSLTLNYGQNLILTITSLDGYKPTQIIVSDKNLDIKPNVVLENITNDTNVSVTFTKLATWLDLDENNQPERFTLSDFVGFGTETNPYIISNYNDFLTLCYNVNVLNIDYTGKYFKSSKRDLKINLSRYYFVPITSFNGTILGDNLTISGLKIYSDGNAALFKLLETDALIKSINLEGEIEGNFNVSSIASVNNGTILGCSNKASITNNNNLYTNTNIIAGICATNNGTISRTYNEGTINSQSVKVAGICAINNGTIDNIYNTGMILSENNYVETSVVAGICAENNNIIQIGYNDSRVINKTSNENMIVVGTVQNKNGSCQNLYFNSNKLSIIADDARTYEELTNKENEIYVNFDSLIWQFKEYQSALPTLKTCYEYLGTLSFQVIFDENLNDSEKLVLAEVFNEVGETYGLALRSQSRIYKIANLSKGLYKIRLKSVLGSLVSTDNNLEIEMNENTGENISIKIVLTKTQVNGYYGYVII